MRQSTAGRLTAVVQPSVDGTVPVTRYTYDEVGNQLTQTDALNRTTRYVYDDLDRRIGRQLPAGQSETVNYYRSGTVMNRTDFNGTVTTYTYDALNRLLSRTSNHPQASLSNASFTYTASGQRQTMTDATGTITYTYDHRDRLQSKETPQGTITYGYEDASGLLTGMHTSTPNGAFAAYTYDALSRLKTVRDVNNQVTTYEYDANGNLEQVLLPNGITSTYTYSATNRLQLLSVQKGEANLAQFNYTLAATGHRYRSSETGAALQPGNPATVRSRTWNYDALWRLRSETLSGGVTLANGQSLPNGSVTYTLDAVGNCRCQRPAGWPPAAMEGAVRAAQCTARTSSIAGLASQTFSFDPNDRVEGDLSDNNGNTLAGAVSQPSATGTSGNDSYDSENCRTSDLHNGLWQASGRRWRATQCLVSRTGTIAHTGATVSLLYDGDGHKVSESVTKNGVTTTTTHLVDELNPTGYAQVIEEKVNATLTRVYLFGHDLISQDVAAQPGDPWQLVYFGYDGHGSTRFLTNAQGEVTDTYEYDAFGELLAHTGTTPNRYRYCGEQWSEALDLYYLRARLMNPLTGRFWTMDSYEGAQSAPVSFHKYLYANADAVNAIDPSGYHTIVEIQMTTIASAAVHATSALAAVSLLFAANQILDEVHLHQDAREIEGFVGGKNSGPTSIEIAALEASLTSKPRNYRRKLYLHYSFTKFAESLVLNGLRGGFNSWATRDVYATGWEAKDKLALYSGGPRDSVYIVWPRRGYEPTGGGSAAAQTDTSTSPPIRLQGGGTEYIFPRGSGGFLTVFGPIPIPEGNQPR